MVIRQWPLIVVVVLWSATVSLGADSDIPLPTSYVMDITETTPLGPVTGFVANLSEDFTADIFLGIPFAQPPVDERRFEKPEPVIPWHSPLLAQKFSPGCWPHHLSGLPASMFSDDCLYLNIFRPHDETAKPATGWPVLVWVHGGGYVVGAAFMYGYHNISLNFASQGIIVVTIQYRLAFTGFSSTGDEEMPGNLGYWDQTEAFKFLKENIQHFGGDPEKIVAFGLSAGGGSTSALSMSPHARDYITSSIEMSGSVYANWAASDSVIGVTKAVAKEIGCPVEDSAELKKCYKKTKPEQFLEAIIKLGPARKDINLIKYNPRVDEDFFPKDFPELIKEAPPKPAMIGFTDQESAYFTIMGLSKTLNELYIPKDQFHHYTRKNFTEFVETIVAPETAFGSRAKSVQQKIIEFYLHDEEPGKSSYYLTRYSDLLSDILFNIPALWEARAKNDAKWPTYLYFNDYYNKDMFGEDIPVKGSMHANEYPYMFGIFAIAQFKFNDDDYKVQKAIIDPIVAFTKTGDPSTTTIKWPKVTSSKPFQNIQINSNPSLAADLLPEKLQFWDTITKTYDFDIIRGIHKGTKKPKDEL